MNADVEVLVRTEDSPVHVYPCFGREHEVSEWCWCHPTLMNWFEVEMGEHSAYLYVHNVMH